ncbi:MAG TPA: polysaccharide biosynthesis/export family protein [Acidocella sp.]|nr:polysaccharide biosynthesis/export family protein [Acidocella sp.]
MVLRRVLLGGLPALLTGCAAWQAPGYHLPPLPAASTGPYLLGPGDVLTLRVYDQDQISGTYHLDDSGFIDLPLLGLVRAGGASTGDLAARITAALQARQLILHPSVAVEVSAYRPFYILGEVNSPGQYPYRPGMTVLTAISIAGGFTYRAETDYVGLTRDLGSKAVQYRAQMSAMAKPGDVVTVFERRF